MSSRIARAPVVDIWPSQIDAGVLAGMPIVMVRLATEPSALVQAADVVERVKQIAQGMRWVFVVGREPCARDLTALSQELRSAGYLTGLVTRGTHAITGKWSWIILTPRPALLAGESLKPASVAAASELRWDVGARHDIEAYRSFLGREMHQPTCALVVVSQQSTAALCVSASREYGWRVAQPGRLV